MSAVATLWTAIGSAALTLAVVHGIVWLLDRRGLGNLAFSVVALSVAGLAFTELGMMHAASPAEYGQWVRWFHLPNFLAIAGIVAFVHLEFGTGRVWLAAAILGLRSAILIANFLVHPNINWREIASLAHIRFLGEQISVVGEASVRPTAWMGVTASLLLIAYVLDAAVRLWRGGDAEARRKVLLIAGGIVAFLVLAIVQSQLVVFGVVRMPVFVTPPFLILMMAMTTQLCRDIVASARVEREARRLRDELAHVARVSTLSELSGSLAHELNQPLGAILRNAEAAEILLRSDTPDLPELREILADIRADDQRAGAIVDRTRALLKRKSLELQEVSLPLLARDVMALARGDAGARRVMLECVVPEDLPLVRGDRVQLSQVLLNLLVNAMDAVSATPGSARRVSIEARHKERTVEIAVADSGPGVDPALLPRVFDPFVTTKPHGLGIGLAVSRAIVEAHGGRLWAQNNPQRGATFRFTLPVAMAGA